MDRSWQNDGASERADHRQRVSGSNRRENHDDQRLDHSRNVLLFKGSVKHIQLTVCSIAFSHCSVFYLQTMACNYSKIVPQTKISYKQCANTKDQERGTRRFLL